MLKVRAGCEISWYLLQGYSHIIFKGRAAGVTHDFNTRKFQCSSPLQRPLSTLPEGGNANLNFVTIILLLCFAFLLFLYTYLNDKYF